MNPPSSTDFELLPMRFSANIVRRYYNTAASPTMIW